MDTSHTGRDDIIMGSDASGFYGCRGGWLIDYRYVSGRPKLVWQRCTSQTIWSSPTVGILNDTGRPAVVVGTSYYQYYRSSATDEIFAFYADNGQPVPGWPVKARGPTFGSPAIGRLDGEQAVVTTSCARCLSGPGVISAWTGAGRLIWSRVFSPHNEATSSPVLVDVTGGRDNGDDVLVGAAWGLYMLSGKDGSFLYNTGSWASTLDMGCDAPGSPAVGYVPGAPGNGWMLYSACGGPTLPATLAAYPFPVAPGASDPPSWPEWRANADRTGVADPVSVPRTWCGPITPKAAGYRISTSDGKVFTRGNLPYCGGLNRSILPSPVVSMASTPDTDGYWLLLADGSVYAFGNRPPSAIFAAVPGTAARSPPVRPRWASLRALTARATSSQPPTAPSTPSGTRPITALGAARGATAPSSAWRSTRPRAATGSSPPRGPCTARTLPISALRQLTRSRHRSWPWPPRPLGPATGSPHRTGTSTPTGPPRSASATHGRLASPVIGIASSAADDGYWLATADGAILHVGKSGTYGNVPVRAHSEPLAAFSSAS